MSSKQVDVVSSDFDGNPINNDSWSGGGGTHAPIAPIILKACAIALIVLGISAIAYPLILQQISSRKLAHNAEVSEVLAESQSPQHLKYELEMAHRYNTELAKTGQPFLGEIPTNSPYSTIPASSDSDHAGGYQSLLDQGEGIMATITIPKISVRLPIYHGTDDEILANGAGHLYGSSLPVGGPSTHAVIAAHTGMTDALMFTRLDEMRIGDGFSIKSMGRTLSYRVDRINVILPDDDSKLRIEPGQDRVTLMTCTPYGINDHRLLVSAIRTITPAETNGKNTKRTDMLEMSIIIIAAISCLTIKYVQTRNKPIPAKHHKYITSR